MKVLDLFSGLGGWSRPFVDRGHEVLTVDLDPDFRPDICTDIRDLHFWQLPWTPDIVLASPPCQEFSMLNVGKHWEKSGEPKTAEARQSLNLVRDLKELVYELHPRWFVIENPRARLRTLDVLPFERRTVWYCRLGEPVAKPTDLWGGFPESLELPPTCKPGHPDHIAAPRGSKSGTRGVGRFKPDQKNMRRGSLNNVKAFAREYYGTNNQRELAALRAKVPYALGLTVCLAAERDL